ncbi:MAG TPA: SMC family ATPase, partial [Desulfuromonadaceae bacterium]
MQILSIHLKNIKSHRDTELSFSSGINVLSGPNGAGKSTIFEAIGYALFGVDAKDFVSNADRFLSIGAKKGEISVVFRTNDDQTWRVSRTVGAGAKWLLARESGGSFEVEDHARMEETEARIAGLLGLDNGRALAEQFKLVIGPFQNDFLGPFVIKQPAKRQEAFDEILGIDAWRKTYKGTSSLLSAVQERIKIVSAEVTVKQEQLTVLPDKETEFRAITHDLVSREQTLKAKESYLKDMEQRLIDLDNREKSITALSNELQLLQSRIQDGDGKIAEQRLRVAEAQQALMVLDQSRAGKEAFEKSEAYLTELRRKEQERRGIEQEIAGLEKEVLRLTQSLGHERSEVEKIAKQLVEEQHKLDQASQELQVDVKLSDLAARRPTLRQEADQQRAQRSLLEGRRESLLEGKDKLAAGICTFLQEECRNIAGIIPHDLFSNRLFDLERQMQQLDTLIEDLSGRVKQAEAAEQELNGRQIRLQELDKQVIALAGQRKINQERTNGLDRLTLQQTEAT